MPTVSRKATFAAPAQIVWATLVDPSWAGSWFGAETSITKVSGEGLGARQEVTASVKGKGVSLVIETTDYEEGRLLTQRLVEVGGKQIDGLTELACELSEHGTGTAVTVSSTVPEAKGFMGKMVGFGRAHLEAAAAQQTLKRLERLVVQRYDLSLESQGVAGAAGERDPEGASGSETSTGEDTAVSSEIPKAPPQAEMPGFSELKEQSGETPMVPSEDDGQPAESDSAAPSQETSEAQSEARLASSHSDQASSAVEIPQAPPMPEQPEPPQQLEADPPNGESDDAVNESIEGRDQDRAGGSDLSRTGSAQVVSVTEALDAVTPKEGVILERVQSWARTHPLIQTSRFSGAMTLEFNPAWQCIVTRVIEERDEFPAHVPSNHGVPDVPRYGGLLESIPVEPPTDFEERSWNLIRQDSEQVVPCPASCAGGQVQCTRCQGGTVLCSSCIGSGQRTETRRGAGGQTYQATTQCSWCGGSGRRPCGTCRGNGWLVCPDCDGSSGVIQFTCALISNRPEAVAVGTTEELPPEIKLKKVNVEEWQRIVLSDGTSVPAGLPEALSNRLQAELEEIRPTERLRKLEIQVLPVTTVIPERGGAARVHVVGEGGRVFSHKANSKNRLQAISALLVMLFLLLVLVVVLL
jgi:hypothetical protein